MIMTCATPAHSVDETDDPVYRERRSIADVVWLVMWK
jgi:hypothetical protein